MRHQIHVIQGLVQNVWDFGGHRVQLLEFSDLLFAIFQEPIQPVDLLVLLDEQPSQNVQVFGKHLVLQFQLINNRIFLKKGVFRTI